MLWSKTSHRACSPGGTAARHFHVRAGIGLALSLHHLAAALLENRADPNCRQLAVHGTSVEKHGMTALMFAAKKGNARAVAEEGATVPAVDRPASQLRSEATVFDPDVHAKSVDTDETSSRPTIGILTGGGDCPGLNAVIRAETQREEGAVLRGRLCCALGLENCKLCEDNQ